MATRGDPANLQDPIAQKLLQSTIPARLGFAGSDGSPRVTPIWFSWDGRDVVMSTGADSSKLKAIRRNPRVALTIDSEQPPYKVLNIRGTAAITVEPRATAEYEDAAARYFGKEMGAAWISMIGGRPFARIAVRPEWVEVVDLSGAMARARELAGNA